MYHYGHGRESVDHAVQLLDRNLVDVHICHAAGPFLEIQDQPCDVILKFELQLLDFTGIHDVLTAG